MALQDCIKALKDAAGGKLTEDEIADLAEEVEKRIQRKRGEATIESDDTLVQQAISELNDEAEKALLVERRSRAINVLRKQKRLDAYEARPGKEVETLSAINVGSERGFLGAGKSVDAETQTLELYLAGGVVSDLRKEGLLDLVKKSGPEFERDVARELWHLYDTQGKKAEPIQGSSLHARKVAEIFSKYQEAARNLQNEAGAFIDKLPNWIVRQSHDQLRVVRAGFDEWRKVIEPKLAEKTFEDLEVRDREKFLRDIYFNLASGNHMKATGANDDWLMGFKGSGNLAKRVSQHRVLHFKSADDWFEYNQQFGSSSLIEGVYSGLRSAARNTALMRTWGTNPRAAFLKDIEDLTRRAKERGDFKTAQKLNGGTIRAQFDEIDGGADIPTNPSLAGTSRGIRALEGVSKLTGLPAQFADLATRASTLRHNGINYFEGLADGFQSLLQGRGSKEKLQITDLLGAGIDGILGNISSRQFAGDGVPGRLGKLQDTFFRVSGVTFWNDSLKAGTARILSRNLAMNKGKTYGDLFSGLRTNFRRYGIEEKHWDVIRQVETKAADGVDYVTPDTIKDLPDEAFEPLIKEQLDQAREASGKAPSDKLRKRLIKEARRDLEFSLRTYIVDQVGEAATTPGARQRALAYQGTKNGTVVGEAIRFIQQFKLYPITYGSRHLVREFVRNDRIDKTGLAFLIAGTTGFGYLSMVTNDILHGREPRDPRDILTWVAAFKKGGGAGIYGDLLLGEYNKQGGGLIETLAGPTAGTAGQIARVFAAAVRGEDAGATAARTVSSNLPFANLFYTRQALDYLVNYHIQEMINPGFLQRMERRIKKENNQEFILQPSSVIQRGGGFK
jgi:hypothetical protein